MKRASTRPAIPCRLEEAGMAVIPTQNGLRLGGTMEFSGYDQTLNSVRLNALLSGASRYFKRLRLCLNVFSQIQLLLYPKENSPVFFNPAILTIGLWSASICTSGGQEKSGSISL